MEVIWLSEVIREEPSSNWISGLAKMVERKELFPPPKAAQ